MTKKFLSVMMAIAALFATSCNEEVDFGANASDTSVVSISVATPEIATRAYSDGTTATHLQYAVYDEDGRLLNDLTVTNGEINGSTTIKLQLVTGDTYSIIFWAAAPNAPYSVDFENKTMTVNYTNAVSNDENRDAFYAYHEFEVTGAQTEKVILKRPFAQLNIGTADYTVAQKAGYKPNQSAVTVTDVANTLYLATGEVAGMGEVVFASDAIPTTEEFPVAGNEYIAMNYLLVSDHKALVDVTFTHCENGSNGKTRTVANVPVQRNYQTNIYGEILTSDVDVKVEINPEYEKTSHDVYTVGDAASLTDVIDNAAEGSTIVLSKNVDYGTITVNELKGVTIEGEENTKMRFVTSADSKIENVTVKNLGFEFVTGAGQKGGAFVVIDANAQIKNLVIENCTIVGDEKKNSYGICGQNPNASIVVKDCNFSNLGYAIQAIAGGGYESLVVENCTFRNINSWVIMPQYGFNGNLTITGCTFEICSDGIVKTGAFNGDTFTFTNNTIADSAGHDGKDSKWFEVNASAATKVISGNTKDGESWTPGAEQGLK